MDLQVVAESLWSSIENICQALCLFHLLFLCNVLCQSLNVTPLKLLVTWHCQLGDSIEVSCVKSYVMTCCIITSVDTLFYHGTLRIIDTGFVGRRYTHLFPKVKITFALTRVTPTHEYPLPHYLWISFASSPMNTTWHSMQPQLDTPYDSSYDYHLIFTKNKS
jgi:hypothetical protein